MAERVPISAHRFAALIIDSGKITVSGVTLHVHVLNDGSRVIEAPDVERLFQVWANGTPLAMQEAEVAAHFIKGMR